MDQRFKQFGGKIMGNRRRHYLKKKQKTHNIWCNDQFKFREEINGPISKRCNGNFCRIFLRIKISQNIKIRYLKGNNIEFFFKWLVNFPIYSN